MEEAEGVAEWVGDPGRQSESDVGDAVGGGEAVLVDFVDHDAILSEFVEFGVEVGEAPEGLGLGVGGASSAQRQCELGAGGSDDEAMLVAFEDREPELLVVEAVGGVEVGYQQEGVEGMVGEHCWLLGLGVRMGTRGGTRSGGQAGVDDGQGRYWFGGPCPSVTSLSGFELADLDEMAVVENLGIMALPFAVQEMVFAVWLIVKGFDQSAGMSGVAPKELASA